MSTHPAFLEMDDILFDEFAVDAMVARDGGTAVPVRVVIDTGVERLGEFGQVVARVDVASFRNADWPAKPGDELTIGGNTRRIDDIDADDGYVSRAVLHG